MAAPMTSLLPTWPVVTMRPPTGEAVAQARDLAGSSGSTRAMTSSCGMYGTRISSTRYVP